MKAIGLTLSIFFISVCPAWSVTAQTVAVPFVGCASDGQLGFRPAPEASSTPRLSAKLASRLAWYTTGSIGVLGPRGWRCLGLEGSSGVMLLVMPDDPQKLASSGYKQIRGPAIQLSTVYGQTSGRFEAAKIAARLFPDRQTFVDAVASEGIVPRAEFDNSPFPHDRTRRLHSDQVSFETPPYEEGMGTMSRLARSENPIEGMAKMNEANDVTTLVVRLNSTSRDLAPTILGVELP